jgi:hypothetical protein
MTRPYQVPGWRWTAVVLMSRLAAMTTQIAPSIADAAC